MNEARYSSLTRSFPDRAETLFDEAEKCRRRALRAPAQAPAALRGIIRRAKAPRLTARGFFSPCGSGGRGSRILDDAPVDDADEPPSRGGDAVVVGDEDDGASLGGAARERMSITCAPEAESRLPVGSSARMMGGCAAIARAIATRCCCPPESWAGWWCSRSAQPHLAQARPRPDCAALAAGDRRGSMRGSSTFSRRGEGGDEVEALEDEADPPVADARRAAASGDAGDVLPRRAGTIPRVGQVEAAEQVHQRGFARPRPARRPPRTPPSRSRGKRRRSARTSLSPALVNLAHAPQLHKRHNNHPRPQAFSPSVGGGGGIYAVFSRVERTAAP